MDQRLRERILARRWFYEFRLPDGSVTESYLPASVRPIHDTRRGMLLDHLARRCGADWSALRCLDLACHEGFFAVELARRGCCEVLGIDARQEHVDHAGWIASALGLDALRFRRGDLGHLDFHALGKFDVVLLFGILYHVPDVIGALRAARELTAGVCVIETQVAPELGGTIEWGSVDFEMPVRGCLAIVDESAELSRGNREASVSEVSLVPSLGGLLWLLRAGGFGDVRVLEPPPGAYEQLARGRRVMVAAEP
jgi:SAM-dependent methyltransferase